MKRALMSQGVAIAALLVSLSGCGAASSDVDVDVEGLRVVATTPVLADFASVIGGKHVQVYNVVKANVDLHDYEPTPADLQAIGDADVIIENGVGLEGWFASTRQASGGDAPVVIASSGVALRTGFEGHDEKDPHIWHDPNNAKIMVKNITDALTKADPAHVADFEANRTGYDAQLDALRSEIGAQITALDTKKLVTNHDALGYYVAAYGLDYVGSVIPSFDSQAELSGAQIADLVAKIKAEGVRAVFSETTLPPKAANTIALEAGVKIVEGNDAIYGDSLGVAGSGAATYLEMERHNTHAIVTNLH